MRSRLGGQSIDFESPQLEHHRRQQPDLAGSEHERPLGMPNLQTLLRQERLLYRLCANAGWLGKDTEMFQVLRHFHDVVRIVDEVLGEVSMAEIDPPLVIDFFAGDVVSADLIEQRITRPADRARDEVTRLHLGHLVPHFDDLPEALVSDDEVFSARRGVSVERLVDLPVGCIDTNLEHLDQYRASFGDAANVRLRLVAQFRDWYVAQVDGVR